MVVGTLRKGKGNGQATARRMGPEAEWPGVTGSWGFCRAWRCFLRSRAGVSGNGQVMCAV